MSGPRLPAVFPRPHPLSEAASSILYRIPELLRHLHDLENEEAELDAKARQLAEELPWTKNGPSTPPRPVMSTPVPKLRSQAMENKVDRDTPLHVDSVNIETPVKNFLLMESFALAMSLKSKRKGRIFMTGGSTEFGVKR